MENPLPELAVTSDEYLANYSLVEKNILYQYALTKMAKIQTPPELSIPEATQLRPTVDDGELTEEQRREKRLETLKKERDLKRRRIAYRKKVSTKNKSHTEVTREIISNMMEALFNEKVEDTSEEQSVDGSRSEMQHPSNDRKCDTEAVDGVGNASLWARRSQNFHQKEDARHRRERRNLPSTSDSASKDDRYSREKSRSIETTSHERNAVTFVPFNEDKDHDKVPLYEGRNWERDRHKDKKDERGREREKRRDTRDREYNDKDRSKNKVRDKDRDKGEDREKNRDRDRDRRSERESGKKRRTKVYQSSDYFCEVKETFNATKDKKKSEHKRASSPDVERKKKKHKKKKERSLEKS